MIGTALRQYSPGVMFLIRIRNRFFTECMLIAGGSWLRIPPGVSHWAEPLGDEPALNLDVFAPIRQDYRHLVEYQEPDFATG